MSPLQLSLILHTLFSYLSLITTLPITSKPLDNTPEHLTWEAWLMVDSKGPSEQEKTRKITPKSIFITPNFNNVSQPQCAQGYKHDTKGQCIQIVNIDQDEYYKMRLGEILGSTSSHDEDVSYDYDNYDAEQQVGPLQFNIPFNVNFEPKPPDSLKSDDDFDDLEGETAFQETVEPSTTSSTTTTTTVQPPLNVIPLTRESSTTISTTRENDMVNTTTETAITTTPELPDNRSSSTTIRSSPFDFQENKGDERYPVEVNNEEDVHPEGNETTTTQVDEYIENPNINVELQNESFLFDTNETDATTIIPELSSTSAEDEFSEFATMVAQDEKQADESSTEAVAKTEDVMESDKSEIEETKEEMPVQQTTALAEYQEPSTEPLDDNISQPSTVHKQIVLPETTTPTPTTPESVIIITPEKVAQTFSTESASTTSTSSTTTTEKPHISEYSNLKIENDSQSDKVLRDTLIKHEEKETAIENIDTRNRFVYHHLGTVDSTTTAHPKYSITQIRFPSPHDRSPSTSQALHDRESVRFPGPTSQRTVVSSSSSSNPSSNNLTTDKKPFWWLPDGWHVDQNERGNVLLKLWQNRHASTTPTSNTVPSSPSPSPPSSQYWRSPTTVNHRGNSKLPTESLYREISSHDIYKVVSARHLNHGNR